MSKASAKRKFAGHKLNRRNFIQYSSAIAGGMVFFPFMKDEMNAFSPVTGKELFWYQKPLLIMHTVLREIDAKTYDADAVVSYLKKTSANTLVVNTGGKLEDFCAISIQMNS